MRGYVSLVNKYLVSTYNVMSTKLGAGATLGTKRTGSLSLMALPHFILFSSDTRTLVFYNFV